MSTAKTVTPSLSKSSPDKHAVRQRWDQNPLPAASGSSNSAAGDFSPALSAKFREKIRPVLNSIDKLRSHGLQNELRLPTVAVVGDQSVGKSSVLEAISGVDLPRGGGMVTRCPLQLSMRSRSDGCWIGRISYKDSTGADIKLEIPDKSQVDKFVRDAQNAITGSATGVSEGQIDLLIEGPDVGDLTLIDLPGIARYSESHANICAKTKDLIRLYIEQEQVIILIVVPCHVDIETVEAIALAKEVDPDGVRTIGVMTCPDLTNPGSEDDVIATVSNMGSVKLKKGFVMVKCRSPSELKQNISLSDVSKIEADFFANHRHFSAIPKDLVGTRTLAEKLTDELFGAVAKGLETLDTNLKIKLSEFESELIDLGDSLCDSDDQKSFYLASKLGKFVSRIKAETICTGSEFAVGGCASKLYSGCLKECAKFGTKVQASMPAWIVNLSHDIPQSVTAEVQQLRGHELPTFTFVFPVVHRIVREEYLPKVKDALHLLLKTVHAQVTRAICVICDQLFSAFPQLLETIKETVARVAHAKLAECQSDLLKLMSHEGRLFTQDSVFNAKSEEVVKLQQRQRAAALSVNFIGADASPQKRVMPSPAPAAQTSQTAQPSELSNAEHVRLGTAAYLSLAAQRISDTVPMSVLSHMLDGVAADLETETTRLFSAGGGRPMMELLREEAGRKRRRGHLVQAVQQMKESQVELMKAKRSRLAV